LLAAADAPSGATWKASSAAPLCVELTDDAGNHRRVPVSASGKMELRFRHSLYGSRVDEVFSPLPGGFLLIQLRYGEARLVEFYGHESAQEKNGVWIVTPAPTVVPSLNLRSSADAAMSLHVDQPDRQELTLSLRGAARLTVAPCDPGAHG
jgi:hypothetical protein